MTEPPDHAQRARAIAARERNVLIDAGAGAGKTTILVARVLALVAPSDDASTAFPLERIEEITALMGGEGRMR